MSPPPPVHDDHLRPWAVLFVILALASIPLLVELSTPHTTRTMEQISLLSSQETWFRATGHEELLTGEPRAPTNGSPSQAAATGFNWQAMLIPTWNGRPRINKPPLLVWLNVAAWYNLDPETATPQQLVFRARLLAVGLALLAIASTFWAGYSVGDLRTAGLAALVTGSAFLFIRQGRIASYDTYLLGFVTLSFASGLWAMRPLKPINWISRRVIGWFIAGVALGAAILIKGPIAILFMFIPLLMAILVTPRRRLGNMLGLLFALLLGVALAAPWYLYVIERIPDAWDMLFHEYQASRHEAQPVWYYLGLFGLVFPWTVWLIASLFQPFLRASGERRRQFLIGWLWFIAIFVIMSIPAAKQQRYIVPILPAMGILVAQLWTWHAQLAEHRQNDKGVNLLRIPHWVMILFVSLTIGAFWAWQNQSVDFLNHTMERMGLGGHLEYPDFGQLPWYTLTVWSVALVIIALLGMRWHWRWRPVRAAVATAVWMFLLASVGFASYARTSHSIYDHYVQARKVHELIADHEMAYLYVPQQDRNPQRQPNAANIQPEEQFLFYVQRVVNALPVDELMARSQTRPESLPMYLFVRVDAAGDNDRLLQSVGYRAIYRFDDGMTVKGVEMTGCGLYEATDGPSPQKTEHAE